MKRIGIVAAVTALALASAPAFADDNKGKGKQEDKKSPAASQVEINGTVASVVDTNTVTVLVKASGQPKALKALTKTLKDTTITVKSDTNTVVKKGGKTIALGALAIGDKVNLRAKCTAGTPVVCVASRVTAAAAPTPKPSPSVKPATLEVRGVATAVVGSAITVVVTSADGSDSLGIKDDALRGTTITFQTDTATVVTKAGANVALNTLVNNPVTVWANCTTSPSLACTAKRIAVIVPAT